MTDREQVEALIGKLRDDYAYPNEREAITTLRALLRERDAAEALAYERAAEAAYQWCNDDDAQELREHFRALASDDATAALAERDERIRREAVKAERARIAARVKQFADAFDGKSSDAKERRARGISIAIYHDIIREQAND